MGITWEAHAADFKRQEALAVENRTCFCKCGCRERGARLRNFFGATVPGLGPECEAAAKTRAGRKVHMVATRAADTWVEPEDEQPPSRLRRFIERTVSDDSRQVATAYARVYGSEGLVFMAAMHDKVTRGEELTDAQVEAVLRSKRAEERSVKAAYHKAVTEHVKVGKQTDLTRLVITDDITAGYYAVDSAAGPVIVEIDRPTTGTLRGFVVVKVDVGEGIRKYGVQYPQPARKPNESTGYVQAYRGHLPQLVAVLLSDPKGARERYDNLMGKPVDRGLEAPSS